MAMTFDPSAKGADITLSLGNLKVTNSSANQEGSRATVFKSTGKWYWELLVGTIGASEIELGLGASTTATAGNLGFIDATGSLAYTSASNRFKNGSSIGAQGTGFSVGDTIGFAWDAGAGTLTVYVNNVSQASFSSIATNLAPQVSVYGSGANVTANFGATALTYSPPAGFDAMDAPPPPPNSGSGAVVLGNISGQGLRIASGSLILQTMIAAGGHNGLGTATLASLQVAGSGGHKGGDVSLQAMVGLATGHAASSGLAVLSPFAAHGIGRSASINAADNLFPVPTITTLGLTGAVGAFEGVLPSLALEATTDASAKLTIPALSLDAALVAGELGVLHGALPSLTAALLGLSGTISSGSAILSPLTVFGVGIGQNLGVALITPPAFYLTATGLSGSVGVLAEDVPALVLNAIGYGPYIGSADLILPAFSLTTTGSISLGTAARTWVLNLRKKGLTEYTNFDFNSYAEYRDLVLAAGSNGVMNLTTADKDVATNIAAIIRTGKESFGSSYNKRVPRIYVGYSTTGSMHFSTITSQDGARVYLLAHNGIPGVQQRRVPVGRGPKSPYWQFETANIEGCDFSIENIQLYPEKTRRRVV